MGNAMVMAFFCAHYLDWCNLLEFYQNKYIYSFIEQKNNKTYKFLYLLSSKCLQTMTQGNQVRKISPTTWLTKMNCKPISTEFGQISQQKTPETGYQKSLEYISLQTVLNGMLNILKVRN